MFQRHGSPKHGNNPNNAYFGDFIIVPNITEYTYTNLDVITTSHWRDMKWPLTPSYKPGQKTTLKTAGNGNIMVGT